MLGDPSKAKSKLGRQRGTGFRELVRDIVAGDPAEAKAQPAHNQPAQHAAMWAFAAVSAQQMLWSKT